MHAGCMSDEHGGGDLGGTAAHEAQVAAARGDPGVRDLALGAVGLSKGSRDRLRGLLQYVRALEGLPPAPVGAGASGSEAVGAPTG